MLKGICAASLSFLITICFGQNKSTTGATKNASITHSRNIEKSPPTMRENLDRLLTAYAKANLFNGSAFIEQGGIVLLDKAYGFSNADAGIRNTKNGKYLVYSITKSITATLILKLVEQGKLQLTDRLSKFYASIPQADQVTIEHLLTHTSGIYAYNNDFSMPTNDELSMINFLDKKTLSFMPGSNWNYSNTGFFLLGFIIQKVTGMAFEKAVEKYIFAPAGMNESGFNYKNLIDPRKTKGYKFIYKDDYKEAPLWDYRELFSAGGMYSTTGDLYKFYKAMRTNKIISEGLTQKAYTAFKRNYGYGWFVDSVFGTKTVSHSGGAPGYRSYLITDPKNDICIVLLCNTENSDVAALKKNILKILFHQAYNLRGLEDISKGQVVKYEGAYRLSSDMTVYVAFEDGRIVATLSGQSTQPLLYEGDDQFYIDEIDGVLKFKKGKFESYDTLVLTQNGQVYTALRTNAHWGIAGSATSNGWNGPDIILTRDSINKNIWVAKHTKLSDGEIKFKFNNDWTYNFGIDNNGRLQKNGQNVKVRSGVYDIRLDLSDVDQPTYSLTLSKSTK